MSLTVTAISPVLRLMLKVSTNLNVSLDVAGMLLDPYCYVAEDGLKRIREDADIPPLLLNAMMKT